MLRITDFQRTVGKTDSQQRAVLIQGEQVVIGIGEAVIDRHFLVPFSKINRIQNPSVSSVVYIRFCLFLIDGCRTFPVTGNCDGSGGFAAPQYRLFLQVICLKGTLSGNKDHMIVQKFHL